MKRREDNGSGSEAMESMRVLFGGAASSSGRYVVTRGGGRKSKMMRDALLVAAGSAAAVSVIEYRYGVLSSAFSAVYERMCTRVRVQATNRVILPYASRGQGRGGVGGGGGGDDDDDDDHAVGLMYMGDGNVVVGASGKDGGTTHVDASDKDMIMNALGDGRELLMGNHDCESELSSGHTSDYSATPNFFASTKFFACLGIEECRELFEATETVHLADGDCLFTQGDASEDGIYIVLEGSLGVFLPDENDSDERNQQRRHQQESPYLNSSSMSHMRSEYVPGLRGKHFHTNTLRPGESVGDIDIMDGAPRSVTCIALENGARLQRVSRNVFMQFVSRRPLALQTYLEQAVSRLWRVSSYMVHDFLHLPRTSEGQGTTAWDTVEGCGNDLHPHRAAIESSGKPAVLRPGARLYSKGTYTTDFFIVMDGELASHDNRIVVCANANASTSTFTGSGAGGSSGSLVGAASTSSGFDDAKSDFGNAESVVSNVESVGYDMPIVGAAAFFTRSPRLESIRALTTVHLLRFGPKELEELHERDPEAHLTLLLCAARSLGPTIRKFISMGLNRVWLRSGDVAYSEGDVAESMYFIISGRIRVLRNAADSGPMAVTEEAGRGTTFGEESLLYGPHHDASALCVRDCELVRMSKGSFESICASYPQSAVRLLELVASRYHRDRSGKRERTDKDLVTISVLPAGGAWSGDASSLVHTACKQLTAALSIHGSALHIGRAQLVDAFGTDSEPERLSMSFYRSKVGAWLAAMEEDHCFIVLEGDVNSSPWSNICAAQADCVVFVAAAEASPELGPMEVEIMQTRRGSRSVQRRTMQKHRWVRHATRTELLLVHFQEEQPRGTAEWLVRRPNVSQHHHVLLPKLLFRTDTAGKKNESSKQVKRDWARLARRFAGEEIGLVLSGGGSRGLAHLGVIRALEEAGIPIDVVGGASQGALMGALYAKHQSTNEMLPGVKYVASRLGSAWHLLMDVTLPIISLFSGFYLDKGLQHVLGEKQTIEDLWLPFFCVTANLTKGDSQIFSTGMIWQVVRASMTIVGLLPPMNIEGDLHVDGGYVNNIPVDVMRKKGVKTVIVVDVENKGFYKRLTNVADYYSGLSGWRILAERIMSPFRRQERLPHFSDIMNALTWLAHHKVYNQIQRDHRIDLYLQPQGISDYGLLDYHQCDRIMRQSYKYGSSVVREWKRRRNTADHVMLDVRPRYQSTMEMLTRKRSTSQVDVYESYYNPESSPSRPYNGDLESFDKALLGTSTRSEHSNSSN